MATQSTGPAVVASGTGLVRAFPDLEADVRWVVAEDDMVVAKRDRDSALGR